MEMRSFCWTFSNDSFEGEPEEKRRKTTNVVIDQPATQPKVLIDNIPDTSSVLEEVNVAPSSVVTPPWWCCIKWSWCSAVSSSVQWVASGEFLWRALQWPVQPFMGGKITINAFILLFFNHKHVQLHILSKLILFFLLLLLFDVTRLALLLLNQVRHGAGTGLREILKSHGAAGGKLVGSTAEQVCLSSAFLWSPPSLHRGVWLQMSRQHQEWIEDLVIRLLCVFALDRFGDFVSDEVRGASFTGWRQRIVEARKLLSHVYGIIL